MDAAFGWIGEFINWIANFIPHYAHIKATHMGVMFTRARTKVLNPGLHWYLPFWSETVLYPVKRQTLNLPPQVLTTLDNTTVLASAIVTYDIYDIHKAMVDTYDFEDTIREVSQISVKKVLTAQRFEDIKTSQDNIDKELCNRITEAIKVYGVRVIDAALSDFGKTRIYRLVGDNCEAKPLSFED